MGKDISKIFLHKIFKNIFYTNILPKFFLLCKILEKNHFLVVDVMNTTHITVDPFSLVFVILKVHSLTVTVQLCLEIYKF